MDTGLPTAHQFVGGWVGGAGPGVEEVMETRDVSRRGWRGALVPV